MGFMDFQHKLKSHGGANTRRLEGGNNKKDQWMGPNSYGYHVVENQWSESNESEGDLVVAQREQIDGTELWYFGVCDGQIGEEITKYMQSHFFRTNLKKSQLRRRSKEAMRRAYLGIGATEEKPKTGLGLGLGSASVIIIGGERLVMAKMGDYKCVMCKNGLARDMNKSRGTYHWSRRFISGVVRTSQSNNRSKEVMVCTKGIDADTEFVILGSTGIWEVMKKQEAVNLVRHLEDPQEAAECLAREALFRLSRSSISCFFIRFH